MENLSKEAKAVLNDLKEKENLKFQALQLPNVRRFFVTELDADSFLESINWVKDFAIKAFLLLNEDYRPDGKKFNNCLDDLKDFRTNLLIDLTETTFEQEQIRGFYKEKCIELDEKVTMLNREIGGLEYLLENYLKNRMFYEQIKRDVTDYVNGHKTEQETMTGFLSSIKEHWNKAPGNDDFFEQLKHNALFMAMANMTAIDYMSGYKTEQETQQKFIEYTRQFWKHSKQEKTEHEIQPMKEAV